MEGDARKRCTRERKEISGGIRKEGREISQPPSSETRPRRVKLTFVPLPLRLVDQVHSSPSIFLKPPSISYSQFGLFATSNSNFSGSNTAMNCEGTDASRSAQVGPSLLPRLLLPDEMHRIEEDTPDSPLSLPDQLPLPPIRLQRSDHLKKPVNETSARGRGTKGRRKVEGDR